jgi:hypothetical protein
MSDQHLDAQENINAVRGLILSAMPLGPESYAESAFHYLETANVYLQADDVAGARRELRDAIDRLRGFLELPGTEPQRPTLREAIERLKRVLLDDLGGP